MEICYQRYVDVNALVAKTGRNAHINKNSLATIFILSQYHLIIFILITFGGYIGGVLLRLTSHPCVRFVFSNKLVWGTFQPWRGKKRHVLKHLTFLKIKRSI